ncbi:MAG: hypothetical protein DA330_07575 [Nitrososphaera sp.]|nr:hypothetical protein [Nitrososphaera sp.]
MAINVPNQQPPNRRRWVVTIAVSVLIFIQLVLLFVAYYDVKQFAELQKFTHVSHHLIIPNPLLKNENMVAKIELISEQLMEAREDITVNVWLDADSELRAKPS